MAYMPTHEQHTMMEPSLAFGQSPTMCIVKMRFNVTPCAFLPVSLGNICVISCRRFSSSQSVTQKEKTSHWPCGVFWYMPHRSATSMKIKNRIKN